MRFHMNARLLAMVLMGTVAACQSDRGPAEPKAEGWTTIEPGGETLCATGTPFRFHVRGDDPDRVIVFLNGGGACWNGDLCDLETEPSPYTPFVDMDSNNPAYLSGVFDNVNPENPFAGWTQIFVPYCTGDSHLGAKDAGYTTTGGKQVTIHHRGKTNVQAALDWLYANRAAPEKVFVTGGSAGAIASPYYTGLVAEYYPQAEVVNLADGAGGYRSPVIASVLEAWGAFEDVPAWPEFALVDRSTASVEDFFRVTAARHPEAQLSRFDNVDDEVQQGFLALLGTAEPVRALLAANNADLARDVPDIRTFSAPGKTHTALRDDRFYTDMVGGVRIVDWTRDLVGGKPVVTLSCEADQTCD
ncbi:pectinacetylesterase family protein [Hyphomonas sp. WL0036]|uniref:pectinacetylesterase family protein n=1 Tax=Hyphomonas sediminis TaxID=2866160 RepID=UPI001C7FE6A7|nr:pectinacetylesterase family protein [Hyphomonas sediminis]MBY9067002.1 pectinacetylesterase family protein [Hyphomonas sediminis]